MLVALSMKKEFTIRTEYEASWAAKLVGLLWRKENLLPLLESNCISLTDQPAAQC